MKAAEQIPLIRFIKIVRKSGGIDASKIHHLSLWIIKLVLFEPLRIIEAVLFNSRIKKHQIIKDPIFILGYYRTGTTFLQRLFSQNKQLGYQTIFHSALPELSMTFGWLLKPLLGFITRLFHLKNNFHKVPFTWDFPGEEDVAMAGFTFYETPNWGNLFPKQFIHYYEDYAWSSPTKVSALQWKEKYSFWLKKLSLLNNGKQLVLKSPPNTARIETLLELFPNARFVCIHRDPLQVYMSCKLFWKITETYYAFQTIPKEEIHRLILDSFNRTMQSYHSSKQKIPNENLFEITHEALAANPFKRFKSLYTDMALEGFDSIEETMHQFIEKTRNYPFTKYELTADERQQVETEWAFHIDYWEQLRKQDL